MFYAPSRIRPDFLQAVRKPAGEGSREKRAGESSGQGPSAHRHTCRTVHGSFLILTSPQSQPDRIFLSGPAGHNAAGSGNSRSAEASRFFPIFPRRDHRRRGSAPAFRPVPCPRLPPMPGYRGMRGLFSGIRPPGKNTFSPSAYLPHLPAENSGQSRDFVLFLQAHLFPQA